MPPGGIHLGAGLGLLRLGYWGYQGSKRVRCTLDRLNRLLFPSVSSADRFRVFSVGLVLGCILPDADLLLCVAIGAVSNIQEEDLKHFHRTFSHSLVVIPLVASAAMLLLHLCDENNPRGLGTSVGGNFCFDEGGGGKQCRGLPRMRHPAILDRWARQLGLVARPDAAAAAAAGGEGGGGGGSSLGNGGFAYHSHHSHATAGGDRPGKSIVPQLLMLFVFGTACGCAFHSFLDLFYVMKLMILWPYPLEFGFPVFFPLELLSEREKKMLMLSDFASDVLFWYVPIHYFCSKHGLHRGRLRFLGGLILSHVAALCFFMREAWLCDTVPTVLFTRRLYIFGVVWVTVLKLSPFLFQDTIVVMAQLKVPKMKIDMASSKPHAGTSGDNTNKNNHKAAAAAANGLPWANPMALFGL